MYWICWLLSSSYITGARSMNLSLIESIIFLQSMLNCCLWKTIVVEDVSYVNFKEKKGITYTLIWSTAWSYLRQLNRACDLGLLCLDLQFLDCFSMTYSLHSYLRWLLHLCCSVGFLACLVSADSSHFISSCGVILFSSGTPSLPSSRRNKSSLICFRRLMNHPRTHS